MNENSRRFGAASRRQVALALLGLFSVLVLSCTSQKVGEPRPSTPEGGEIEVAKSEIADEVRLDVPKPEQAQHAGKKMVPIPDPAPEPLAFKVMEQENLLGESDFLAPLRIARLIEHDTESYDRISESRFLSPRDRPLSTFSIDVDTAAYANVRRFLEKQHRLPPADAVRIEELLNYFSYDYPEPVGEHPFSIITEVSEAPWNREHRLVHIGIQGRRMSTAELPPSNLVFLIDVSGSMNSLDKLPLLKKAFRLLIQELSARDRVAIVVYAGAAGLVLEPTSGDQKGVLLSALDELEAGGSTAGGEGLRLAYDVARRSFLEGGNNRILLATDGDFNVGASSDGEMVRLIERERNSGVYLSVLGFGAGNYKDSKMEKLADHGNGNAAYIDSLLEAEKVLVTEMGGTLFTIAQDTKIQVEFNPKVVKGYRLIGYENRRLADADFADDTKDAGELGAGHSVTALYDVILADSAEPVPSAGALRYQDEVERPDRSGHDDTPQSAAGPSEMLWLKLRYKQPGETRSRLLEAPVSAEALPLGATSDDFRFAAAVAEMGLLLAESEYRYAASFESAIELARGALGGDTAGHRQGFVRLAQTARLLAEARLASLGNN